jgi:6-phosphofructokinase 1
MKTVGILTGGGDAPGLNAVIRAVVRKLVPEGYRILGIRYGWKGLLDKDTVELGVEQVSGILQLGGTILGTSRTNPYKREQDARLAEENFGALGLDALVAMGGEDTLGVANRLSQAGHPVVGVPKTIDNDLPGTDVTFGFDTAVGIATEAIDRLHTTARSHDRVIVVEVMGRHAGWIAVHSGLAGGAHHISVPERKIDLDTVCATVVRRRERGDRYSIIVTAEGAELAEGTVTQDTTTDAFGHVKLGGIGETIASAIEERTGHETRSVTLGHVQRGGTPTAYDRVLATRYGMLAAQLVIDGKFGTMAAFNDGKFGPAPLEEVAGPLRVVDDAFLELVETFLD